jgi:hypothetical protein
MENDLTLAYARLADDAFLSLGAQLVAYVKPIVLPEVGPAVGIFSADGKPLAAAASVEIALAMIRQHDLEPALVH